MYDNGIRLKPHFRGVLFFKELFFEFPQKYEMPHHTFWDILRENNADKDLGASNFVVEKSII